MMKLQPNETELTGKWPAEFGTVRGGSTCDRIDWLVKHHLQKVGSTSSGGQELLFRDPDDSRYWELTHPHGGGPPKLKLLTLKTPSKSMRRKSSRPALAMRWNRAAAYRNLCETRMVRWLAIRRRLELWRV